MSHNLIPNAPSTVFGGAFAPDGEMGPYPLSDSCMPPDGEMGPYPLSDGSMAPDGEMGPYPLSDNTNLLGAQSQYSLYRNYGTNYATSAMSNNQTRQHQHHSQNSFGSNHQYGAGANSNYGSNQMGFNNVVKGHSYKNSSYTQVNRSQNRSSPFTSAMGSSAGSGLALGRQGGGNHQPESNSYGGAKHAHRSNATILCGSNSPVPKRRSNSHGRQDSFRRHSAHARITSSGTHTEIHVDDNPTITSRRVLCTSKPKTELHHRHNVSIFRKPS